MPMAMQLLGIAHLYGMGVAQDAALGQVWLERAATLGMPRASFYLGGRYLWGWDGQEQDRARGMDYMVRAAEMDYGPALSDLGYAFSCAGCPGYDPDLAAILLQRAVALNDGKAQHRLGVLYRDGRGVAVDLPEARRLFRLAALMGVSEAAVDWGQMAWNGEGGPVDLDEAAEAHDLAAAMADPFGTFSAARFRLQNPALYPDRIAAMGLCLSAVDLARAAGDPVNADAYNDSCKEWSEEMSDADFAAARAAAAALAAPAAE